MNTLSGMTLKRKTNRGINMLEEARELMIKFIEVYGFNDEVTIASIVLVDKILNKEGEKKCQV